MRIKICKTIADSTLGDGIKTVNDTTYYNIKHQNDLEEIIATLKKMNIDGIKFDKELHKISINNIDMSNYIFNLSDEEIKKIDENITKLSETLNSFLKKTSRCLTDCWNYRSV